MMTLSVGMPMRLGADLRHHRLQPLAQIDARQRHDEAAGRRRMDQRLAGIAAEIHAGRIVDGGHAAAALLRHGSGLPLRR